MAFNDCTYINYNRFIMDWKLMTGQIKEWIFKELLVCLSQDYSCKKCGCVLVSVLRV